MYMYETKQIPASLVQMLTERSLLPEADLSVLDNDPNYYDSNPTLRYVPVAQESEDEDFEPVLDEWILPDD
jgi:hypothetical protein